MVGIDQSAHRLAKHQPSGADNYLLLQAEAESFWQCLAEAGIGLYGHWLLYPNPWPKANQFKRRVHGHGAFATLARLGGDVELRTNWDIYAQEFFQAASLIGLSGELETGNTCVADDLVRAQVSAAWSNLVAVSRSMRQLAKHLLKR